ncbi:MAG: hypothetical protein DCF16_11450 [Alphaproteobacteria bacterium]|nr:MAG: hypothetical protein DCF16_11450 [Alphaproteobacteria bacterium]
MSAEDIPLVDVDDNIITLRGIVDLSPVAIVVFLAAFAAPVLAWIFAGWWVALCLAVAPLALCSSAYKATFTKIEFRPGLVMVRGATLPASTVGPFVCKYFSDTPAVDDTPGHIEIWLSDHKHEATYVASMAGSADGAAIVRLLNAKLEDARR